MNFILAFREIFIFFLKRGLKSKKTKLFFFIGMIPVLVLLIAKVVMVINPGNQVSITDVISKILMIVYIQLLVPILTLFWGTSIVNEEIDNKTLVFLTTSPIPKKAFILGKYVSSCVLSSVIISIPLVLSFFIINITHLHHMVFYKEFLAFFGVGILGLFSYSAVFLLLGTLLKRPLILGLLFIFGWESIVQYFPGTTQKFTLIHFLKSLLPETSENVRFLVFKLEPSPFFESILVLFLVTGISLMAATFIFNWKEYILSDSNL